MMPKDTDNPGPVPAARIFSRKERLENAAKILASNPVAGIHYVYVFKAPV
ncbi:MAG TPA: hypothetical protein PKJ77_09410 [Thermodesulfobacteriota bacterium]|nr:hypothetical protein [Deltaproteobacteria bacterium]HNR12577.1 hypothetical protein [Thermodesulfobacteriota bacterium]HNU72690.1 hypothetical protein [Thermodesulfobacteriota bacterium]HOC39481.1 hypothetical protein [Thermodesulfobacteriota bacterium]